MSGWHLTWSVALAGRTGARAAVRR